MVSSLERRRESCHAYPRISFTQVRRRRLESLLRSGVRTRRGVAVLDHCIRRQVCCDGAKRSERGYLAKELNALQFASKLQLQHISQRHVVRHAQRERLQLGIVWTNQR